MVIIMTFEQKVRASGRISNGVGRFLMNGFSVVTSPSLLVCRYAIQTWL
jgi:hypothetical protein